MQGYIKIHRQLIENPIWQIKPFSEGQAWIDLLCITNHNKGFIKSKNGQIIELQRGDCGYSILSLSSRWGWSRGKVTRFFSFLMRQQMIQQKTYGKYTVISILNYDKYQNGTTNDTTNETINGQQTDTNNNDKNDKNNNTTILESEENLKIFGEYQNVCLSEKHYGQLLSLCASEELLNELVNSFSINIEVGKERPYMADLPNAHYERLKSYYNFRKRNPQRFMERINEIKANHNSNQDALRRAMEKWVNKQEEAL